MHIVSLFDVIVVGEVHFVRGVRGHGQNVVIIQGSSSQNHEILNDVVLEIPPSLPCQPKKETKNCETCEKSEYVHRSGITRNSVIISVCQRHVARILRKFSHRREPSKTHSLKIGLLKEV